MTFTCLHTLLLPSHFCKLIEFRQQYGGIIRFDFVFYFIFIIVKYHSVFSGMEFYLVVEIFQFMHQFEEQIEHHEMCLNLIDLRILTEFILTDRKITETIVLA